MWQAKWVTDSCVSGVKQDPHHARLFRPAHNRRPKWRLRHSCNSMLSKITVVRVGRVKLRCSLSRHGSLGGLTTPPKADRAEHGSVALHQRNVPCFPSLIVPLAISVIYDDIILGLRVLMPLVSTLVQFSNKPCQIILRIIVSVASWSTDAVAPYTTHATVYQVLSTVRASVLLCLRACK